MAEYLIRHWDAVVLGLTLLQAMAAVIHKRYPNSLANDVFEVIARLAPGDLRGHIPAKPPEETK